MLINHHSQFVSDLLLSSSCQILFCKYSHQPTFNMKFLAVVVIFTVFAGICCEAGRIKGKKEKNHPHGGKKAMMIPRECLKPETADAHLAKMNASKIACFMEMKNRTGDAPMKQEHEHKKGDHKEGDHKKWHKDHGMCMKSCYWQKINVLKVANGTATFNTSAFTDFASNFIDDAAKVFITQLNACAQHKGLSLNTSVGGSNCEGLKKHVSCWRHSIDVACNPEKRAAALNSNGMVSSATGSPFDDDEESDMGMMASSAAP